MVTGWEGIWGAGEKREELQGINEELPSSHGLYSAVRGIYSITL